MNTETNKNPEETPEVIEFHPQFLTGKSSAKWSENKQRYYYKPLDLEYEKRHYQKHKHDMTCEFCGSVVTSQMYKHVKSKNWLKYRDAVQKTMDTYKIEEAESISK